MPPLDPRIRDASPQDAAAVSALVHASFEAHIAADWEPAAGESLIADTSAEKMAVLIAASSIALVHDEGGAILGVIVLPRPTLVQLCFVAPGHVGQGIGRALWEAARARLEAGFPDVRTVELNASPYAVAAYRALGFHPISQPFRRSGAVATRMACWLPGRTLAPAGPVVSSSSDARPVIRTTDTPPEDWLLAVDAGLERHNHAVAPLTDVRQMAAFATDDAGALVGGAVGRTWGACCELLQLWVAPECRSRGVGSALLLAFEAHARTRGCNTFYLTTLSYQAPAFYRRHGYAVLAQISGYPDGIVKFLMQRSEA